MNYPSDIMSEVLYSFEEIDNVAKELGKKITEDYEDKDLVMVCTLKGAVPFFSELIKYINFECNLEFIKASSYIGNTTTTIGNVQISTVMHFEVKNKDILIVEDIVDTGLTCDKLSNYFMELGANSVQICTLLNKPSRRIVDVDPKYVGFDIEDKFVIGFGLDYNQKYRNLPCVGVINPKYI